MMDAANRMIVFDDVSKFYGDILGVNRINMTIAPGITSLVGPNGSGKTTLMNLLTGLLRPTRGLIKVLGTDATHPEHLFKLVGYCSQFDSFPAGMSGLRFTEGYLGLHGFNRKRARELAWTALERVGLTEAAKRNVAGYSKGMRQRVRLAQAIAHQPSVMVLDEPLNGLDPLARAEAIELFRTLAREGLHLIISSHILHEVEAMSDRVVLMNNGYVVAEGGTQGVRHEMADRPLQILVRCRRPSPLAAALFAGDHVAEARVLEEGDMRGLLVRTRNAEGFYLLLNKVVAEDRIENLGLEGVMPVDDDLQHVYEYLIGAGRSH
jgi:ABC-2 type transport system ATP-binding protein